MYTEISQTAIFSTGSSHLESTVKCEGLAKEYDFHMKWPDFRACMMCSLHAKEASYLEKARSKSCDAISI